MRALALWQADRGAARRAARAADPAVLRAIRAAVVEAIATGESPEAFRARLEATLGREA